MEKRIFIALVLLLVIFINFPKQATTITDEKTTLCSCMGFTYSSNPLSQKCIGLVFECREEQGMQNRTFSEKDLSQVCTRKSCQQIEEYLGIETLPGTNGNKADRLNMIIIIDTSYSMIGERMEKTLDATEILISSLNPEDRVEVIEFNTNSRVVHPFTTDKNAVIKSLPGIVARDYTFYIPALEIAQESFTKLNDPHANNVLIFLSDGIPLDNISRIVALSEEMGDLGVGIYTIWIGDIDETEHEAAGIYTPDEILGAMTNIAEGQGFYFSRDINDVADSFDSIYKMIVKEDYYFHITTNIEDPFTYPLDHGLPVIIQLFSNENSRVVPGYLATENDILCVDSAEVNLIIKDTDDKLISIIPTDYLGGQYLAEVNGLPEGNYILYAEASVILEYGSDCSFKDTQKIAFLQILSHDQSDCEQLTCTEISALFQDPLLGGELLLPETKRVLFVMDSSASMNDENRLLFAKSAISRMVHRLTQGFTAGLIRFDSDASLTQGFTSSKKEFLDSLQSIETKGTTRYIPAFHRASATIGTTNFDPSKELPKDFVIFLSDGLPWDKGGAPLIIETAENLIRKGVCIFTIGYGSDVARNPEATRILTEIADLSQHNLGCGRYSYADPSEQDLDRIFQDIYSDITLTGEIFIRSRINSQIFQKGDTVTVFSDIYSSYNGIAVTNIDPAYCPVDAHVSATFLDQRDAELSRITMNHAKDIGYNLIKQDLPDTTSVIRIDAFIEDFLGTSCDLHGTSLIPVRILQEDTGRYPFYLSLSAILLNLSLLVVLLFTLLLLITKK